MDVIHFNIPSAHLSGVVLLEKLRILRGPLINKSGSTG